MNRRAILGSIAAAAVPWAAAHAQKPVVLGLLTISRGAGEQFLRTIRARLREHGFVDGREIAIALRYSDGTGALIQARARELADLKPAVIVASGASPLRAAQRAAPETPIVAFAGDLVALGAAESFARPGGNVTGVSFIGEELNAKRLEILAELLPRPARVLVLADTGSGTNVPEIEASAAALGVTLATADVSDLPGIEQTLSGLRARGFAGVNVLASPVLNAHRRRIIELVEAERLPAIYQWPETVVDGGLIAYGPSLVEMYRQVGSQVARILRGAKPAEIPIERPVRFDLAINLRTAAAIGLTVPPMLVARADEVIE